MTKYLLTVDYQPGVIDTPTDQWSAEDVKAHLDYYGAAIQELIDSGEMVDNHALTPPEAAKVVTSDGSRTEVTSDGPFFKLPELLAGYQLVDVASEERAIEIAAKISRVPGPGGVPLQQPIAVRRVMTGDDMESLG
jgi:hypothetical protein